MSAETIRRDVVLSCLLRQWFSCCDIRYNSARRMQILDIAEELGLRPEFMDERGKIQRAIAEAKT